jgi:hypothetical protein
MPKRRSGKNAERPDLSFYTELRYPGSAAEIVARFTAATRELLERLAEDLRSDRRGEFGTDAAVRGAIAVAADRVAVHVDLLEAIVLGAPAEQQGDVLRNVVANVVSDANLAGLAEEHVASPKQAEAKFDEGQGGAILDSMPDVADKANDIGEALSESLPFVKTALGLAAIILRDIGIVGKLAADESGGNDATRQLEGKLDRILPQIDGLQGGQQGIGSAVQRVEGTLDQTRREVFKIEQKADLLGDLLGKTLVGEGWIVDPLRTRDRPNRTPKRSVKEELHDLEDLIREIIIRLGPVTDGPEPPGNGEPFDRPKQPTPEEPVPVLQDWRLKKIFVYAENAFTPRDRNERRTITVRTPAFDLGGWLDLSRLRPGDVVEAQVRVSFANRQNVLFSRTRFDKPGLKCLADFARGQNLLVGSEIRIVLRQTASADDFGSPIELAYQFVVESQ